MNYLDRKPVNYPAIWLTILRLYSAATSPVVYFDGKTDMDLPALTPWVAVFYTHMLTKLLGLCKLIYLSFRQRSLILLLGFQF